MMKKKIYLLIIMCLVLTSILPMMTASAATQATYYVDPVNGNDTNPGTLSQPFQSIEKARDVVRTINSNMTGDIYVYLRGGTYTLTSTLQLTQSDSGTNGYNIIYRNYTGETPIISGGQLITGWTLYDSPKNIWQANVDASLETRQIYVNNIRAIRARSTTAFPSSAVANTTGYTTTDSIQWNNASDIEFVYPIHWYEERCGVANLSGTYNTTITMKQPAWDMCYNQLEFISGDNTKPAYIENAYEFLDEEGEWYLDRTADKLYYKPRAGENMSTVTVTAAKLEILVAGTGTLNDPIHNIQFEGITFADATWLYPNGNEGFPQVQADGLFQDEGYDLDDRLAMPTNISFSEAKNIRFERNKFTRLGASGLGFINGSQDNIISGNEFTDISGSGVRIGGIYFNDCYPSNPLDVVKNNEVSNNYIHNVAVEYRGCVGIFVGYTESTRVVHNELCDLPYTAISIGWGWGARDFADSNYLSNKAENDWRIEYNLPSTSRNNVVSYNHIYNIMTDLRDGGGIYSLGAQPGGIIEGNYIHDDKNDYGAIYSDSGSRYLSVRNNILHSNVKNYLWGQYDNDYEFNYWDIDNGYPFQNVNKTSLMANNYVICNGNVPSSILDNVGLEPAYADLLPRYSVNFALGKTATGYYNDGTLAVMQSQCEAYRATDGNLNTCALAANQYAWTEEVDLGNTYTIDRVVTTFVTNPPFQNNLYATDYEIQVSTIGGNGNFTTVKTVSGCIGGVSEQTFTPVNARYVRIKAIKPDGAGQTGTQMAIAELAVYGAPNFTPSTLPAMAPAIVPIRNLALAQTTAAYYNDGTPAQMQAGEDLAVDGDTSTYALAANQYAWTEEVDLGDIYNVNRVKTTFPPGLYATDYEIQVSKTGGNGNFTTVKTVTGCTGGVSEQTFTPVLARYVRIKAVKPDGPDQTGVQMAIAELEVYEYFNYAYKKTAIGYYNDGTPAIMQSGGEASNAIDGCKYTSAIAANQYAWSEVVDLGEVVGAESIYIKFGDNNWPTDWELAVSNTGDPNDWMLLQGLTGFGVGNKTRSFTRELLPQWNFRYVRIKALKPDGPNQTGVQMAIEEITVNGCHRALKMSQMTDDATADKYYYRTISNQGFTFQSGDVIAYDVKLCTNNTYIGGIDIKNTDGTAFRNATWQDQNGITGTPWCDLRNKAFGKWYHREITVPSSMNGKTSSSWALAFENDSVSTLMQAAYDNIVVKRAGNIVLTVYKSGYYYPSVNFMERSSNYITDAPAFLINRN